MFVETNRNHLIVSNLADNRFDKQESKRCVDDKKKEESDDKRKFQEGCIGRATPFNEMTSKGIMATNTTCREENYFHPYCVAS